jgi:hypothetical protein
MRHFNTFHCLTLVLLSAASFWPTTANATTFTVYDTGNSSELLTELPGDNTRRVLYSLDVGPINPGDILVVASEAELVEDDVQHFHKLASQLILGSDSAATTGTELDENNAFDVFGIHSNIVNGVPVKLATKAFPAGSQSTYINLNVWASGGGFDVLKDYGRLQVLKIEP